MTATLPPTRALTATATPGVYKRGGRYVVRFRDQAGRQRQAAARTLAEARRLRSELVTDVDRGEFRVQTRLTFAAYAETWAAGYAGRTNRGLRPETLKEYRRDLAVAVKSLGRLRLAEITAPALKAYAKELADDGCAPATIRRKFAPVKALLATAVEDGLLRANPSAGLRITGGVSPGTEERVKVLTVEQLEALLAQIPEDRRLLARLIATTGVRISEALGLRWGDLDMPERRLHVRQRIRAGKTGAPKSSAGRREVPLGGEIVRELAALRLRSPWSAADDPVFARQDGQPVGDRSTYRWLKPAAARAGVPWMAWHVLRHTAATRWLLSGVTIPQVSRLLGHEDPGFTLRTYISVMPADLPDGEALAAAVGLG